VTNAINIALFDMDNSVADYEGALLRDLELLRGPTEPVVTAETIWSPATPDAIRNRMDLIKRQPGWWFDLKPIAQGMDILNLCRRLGYDVHILTKGPKRHPNAWEEKVRWCQKYLGADVDIHVTSDKGLVYGKLLYDDYPDYMLRWLAHRPRGLGIMPVTASNRDFTHPNVIRWDGHNLEEVTRAVVAAQGRVPGQKLILKGCG
jgi:hypothetical protein